MPRYSAGSASLSVVPDLTGFQKKMSAELGRIGAVKVPVVPELDRTAMDRVVAQMSGRTADVTVRANLDRTDVDRAVASINRRDASIKVKADTSQAQAAIAALGAATGLLGSSMGATLKPAAFTAAAGGLLAVAGAAGQAAGALALLPALGAAAAAPLAALLVGTQGLGTAFKAFSANQKAATVDAKSAGTAQAAAAEQVISASRGVESARRGVESAARGVAAAERQLASAQLDEQRAQEKLTDARKDAAQQLQDLNESVKGAALDQEAATLAIQRAQENLDKVKADPKATALDRQEADLAYREAVQHLEEQGIRTERLQAQTAAANAAGVEGSQQVIDAKQGVVDAAQSERDAQEGVTVAAEQLAVANDNVAEAQRQLAVAVAAATAAQGAQSTSASALNDALADLSPNARDFTNQMLALAPAFTALRLDVQDALFAGLGDSVTSLAQADLPILHDSLTNLADLMNGAFKDSLAVLNTPQGLSDFRTTLDNVAAGFRPLVDAAAPFVQALIDITTVGSGFLPGIGTAIGAAATAFSDFIAQARDSGALQDFMQTALDVLGQVGDILGGLGSSLGAIFSAAVGPGQDILDVLGQVTSALAAMFNSADGQAALQSFFSSVADVVHALAPVLVQVAGILVTDVLPAIGNFAAALAPIAGELIVALAQGIASLAPILPPVAAAITALATAILPLIPIIAEIITTLLPVFATLVGKLAPIIGLLAESVGQALLQAMVGLAPVLIQVAQMLFPALAQIIGMLLPVLPQLVEGILQIIAALLPFIPPLIQIALALMPSFIDILTTLIPVIVDVINTFAPFVTLLIEQLIPQVSAMAGIFDWAAHLISDVWNGFVKPAFEGWGLAFGALGDAFSWFADLAGRVWGTVQTAFRDGVNGVISLIDEFLDAVNWVADKVGLDLNLHIDHILGPNVSQAGGGTSGGGGTQIRMATGGQVSDYMDGTGGGPVPGVGDRDTVRTLLMPEEIVIRKSIAKPYKEFLLALNAGQPEALQAAGGGRVPRIQRFARGGSVEDALSFARGAEGTPYVWGGVGPGGWDCSGFMSDIANVLAGTPMHQRRFATASMAGGRDAGGFKRGSDGAFVIGVNPSSHTAGTLGGHKVESGSGHGAMVDGRALGADSGFQYKYYFPEAGFFRAGLGDIAQAIADPIMSSISAATSWSPFVQVGGGAANTAIQSIVNWIGGLDQTTYSASGGDSGGVEPVGVTRARTTLAFDAGGWLPPGYSSIYNGTGGPEALFRVKQPDTEGISVLDGSPGGGVTGVVVHGDLITQDVPELMRVQAKATRRARAAAGVR